MGVRELILIRHGQYDIIDGHLTPLGVRQAMATARALRGVRAEALYASTLPRSLETAAILSRELGLRVRPSRLLCEGLPTSVEAVVTPRERSRIKHDGQRIRRAFAKFFKPAARGRTEILVCHGNVIRFFVCLVIGAKPTTWLRMGTHNCSITTIVVTGDDGKKLIAFNGSHHLKQRLRSSF